MKKLAKRLIITGETLSTFIHKAVHRYGGFRPAAKGIQVPYSTLRNWIGERYCKPAQGFDEQVWIATFRARLGRINAATHAALAQLDELSDNLGITAESAILARETENRITYLPAPSGSVRDDAHQTDDIYRNWDASSTAASGPNTETGVR